MKNREIKFRGNRIDGKGWVHGDFIQDYYHHTTGATINRDNQLFEVTAETVGEFTGLTDKNGKEIYEGDFLVDRFPLDDEDLSKGYAESHLPVIWCNKKLMWCVDASFKKDGSFLTSVVEYFGDELEVFGNIHENPELLKS